LQRAGDFQVTLSGWRRKERRISAKFFRSPRRTLSSLDLCTFGPAFFLAHFLGEGPRSVPPPGSFLFYRLFGQDVVGALLSTPVVSRVLRTHPVVMCVFAFIFFLRLSSTPSFFWGTGRKLLTWRSHGNFFRLSYRPGQAVFLFGPRVLEASFNRHSFVATARSFLGRFFFPRLFDFICGPRVLRLITGDPFQFALFFFFFFPEINGPS